MKIAVYAGSFDPLTLGHLQLIQEASKLFDLLHVSIGVNPAKKALFSVEERMEMLTETIKDIPNVVPNWFIDKYLVDYCADVGAQYYVRGLRNEEDYRFEKAIVHINRGINNAAKPVWLPAATEHEHVSSSVVKGLVGPIGWENVIKHYVPEPVMTALKQKFPKTV